MAKNQKLVELRGAKTLLQVATDLDISVSALSQYENSKRFPTPEIAQKLAKYYRTTVDELFYGKSFTSRETESPADLAHTFYQGGMPSEQHG